VASGSVVLLSLHKVHLSELSALSPQFRTAIPQFEKSDELLDGVAGFTA
jgi:hypothetical protein